MLEYWEKHDQDLNEFKYLKRWFDELSERPAVQRAMEVGSDMSVDPDTLSDEEKERIKKLLYNQRARPAPAEGGWKP